MERKACRGAIVVALPLAGVLTLSSACSSSPTETQQGLGVTAGGGGSGTAAGGDHLAPSASLAGDGAIAPNAGAPSAPASSFGGASGASSTETLGGAGAGNSGGNAGTANNGGSGGSAAAPGAAGSGTDPVLPPTAGGPSLAPASGALFGAFTGVDSVSDVETLLGQQLPIRLTFHDWNGNLFDSGVTSDIAQGRVTMVSWEPWNGGVGVPLNDIIAGAHDALIVERAQEAIALDAPVMIRFTHEMNGDWYPWGGPNNGGESGGPETYIAAYRHIHDVFVAQGADQVLWVWSPINASAPFADWNHFSAYYPGDDYVDWLGVSGFNWGSTQPWGWNSFEALFSEFYNYYSSSDKPLMVSEVACTEEGGDKAAWVNGMASTMKAFSAFKAVVYFHIDKETDWRINSSQASLDAFRAMAADPYFLP